MHNLMMDMCIDEFRPREVDFFSPNGYQKNVPGKQVCSVATGAFSSSYLKLKSNIRLLNYFVVRVLLSWFLRTDIFTSLE